MSQSWLRNNSSSHSTAESRPMGPSWLVESSEPWFIQASLTEAQFGLQDDEHSKAMEQSTEIPELGPYYPGKMLSEIATNVPIQVSHALAGAAGADNIGSDSDCSTADPGGSPAMRSATTEEVAPKSPYGATSPGPIGGPWPSSASPFGMQPPGQWHHDSRSALLGSETWNNMPSGGSSGHHIGRCKPCAFLYTKGCRSGADCEYCHLCPPGEKQRRVRVRRAIHRNMGSQAVYSSYNR